MNSKLIKGGLAGVAVVALAAGSTTFAAWSDFGVESTGAGAGILQLNVSDRDGAGSTIQPFSLAPGQNKYQEFFLASADADNVPNGMLTAKIQRLVDTEDNGPGCTTNSEALAEDPTAVLPSGLPSNPLNSCGSEGELSDEATVQILASGPVANAASCPNTGGYGGTTPSGSGTLAAQPSKTFQLGNLAPGEGICVRMEMSLPSTATNATQGDEATFDWRFDLVQS